MEITKRIIILTRVTAMTLITSINIRTISMMMTGAIAILPKDKNRDISRTTRRTITRLYCPFLVKILKKFITVTINFTIC